MKKEEKLKLKLILIEKLATWFGLGNIPKMPGTFGTIGAIPFFILFSQLERLPFFNGGENFGNTLYFSFYFLFLILFFWACVYISDICEKIIYKKEDPQNIVIDEVLGYMTTMFLIPINPITIIAGFILFRIFDITKPGPIKKIQNMENGVGVVIDDFLAGVVANFILAIGVKLWG